MALTVTYIELFRSVRRRSRDAVHGRKLPRPPRAACRRLLHVSYVDHGPETHGAVLLAHRGRWYDGDEAEGGLPTVFIEDFVFGVGKSG